MATSLGHEGSEPGPVGQLAIGRDAFLREWANAAVSDRGGQVAADPWRQSFHVQPQLGALVDPVGLAQLDGVFRLCHLWQPFLSGRKAIFWVHLSSKDLVHWTDPSITLAPSSYYDSHGCYSGSAIVHDGQVHLLYTGNVRTADGGRIPYQCLAALREDGTAVKDEANPLFGPIPGYTPHVRDPQVWADGDRFLMLLGAQSEDLHGSLLLLRSHDLRDWQFLGRIAGGPEEPFGYMWECPGMLRMTDHNAAGVPRGEPVDVLIVSPQFDNGPQAGAGRYVDESHYATGKLSLAGPRFVHGDFLRIDAGPDFYAPRTVVDDGGRVIMFAWMGGPIHEGQPEIGEQHPTVANGWVHCLTVPRSLQLVEGRLVQWPVAELDDLHGEPIVHRDVRIAPGEPVVLPGVEGRSLDLQISGVAERGAALVIRLREGLGQATVVTVEPGSGQVTLDRRGSGLGAGGVFNATTGGGDVLELRLLVDHSSVEVFVAAGRLTMSARIYPDADSTGISLAATGGEIVLDEVTCFPML